MSIFDALKEALQSVEYIITEDFLITRCLVCGKNITLADSQVARQFLDDGTGVVCDECTDKLMAEVEKKPWEYPNIGDL
jgi:hypothetical protein